MNSLYEDGKHPSENVFGEGVQYRERLLQNASIADSRLDIFNKRQSVGGSESYNRDAFEMTVFNRYGWLYPEDELGSTQAYVFIVRPDLNILRNDQSAGSAIVLNTQAENHEYFRYIMDTDPTILWGLTQQFCTGDAEDSHHFIPFLLDRVEEYSVPDYEIHVNEMTQPFTNFKTNYAGNSNDSLSGSSVSITFRETANLRVLKYFHAWIEYMNCLSRGLFEPRYEYKYSKLTDGALRLDYTTSIYFIRVKPNMEIVYFHKQTGLFPKSVPHSGMSYNRGQQPENRVTVEFVGGYPEALNPGNLYEFNMNSGILMNKDGLSPANRVRYNTATNYGYDPGTNYTGGTWGQPLVGSPYIVQTVETAGNPCKYYLGWLNA